MRKKIIICFAVLLLFTTGCLTNPITGKLGPSWEVPLSIPLIAENITVDDLLKKVDFADDLAETSAGYQKEFTFKKEFNFHEVDNLSFTPITIDIEDSGVIPVEMSFSFESKLDFSELWQGQDGSLEGISFTEETTKHLTIVPDKNSGATITKINFGNEEYKGNSIPLKGLTLKDQDELKISGSIAKDSKVESITVTLNVETKDIASVTGSNLIFNIPEQEVDLKFDFPEELENLNFNNVGLKLAIEHKSSLNNLPTLDLRDLKIADLTMPDEEAIFRDNTLITFDSNEATKLVNDRPDAIEIKGKIKTSGHSTLSFDDSFKLEFTVEVPLEFELSNDIVYESKARSIDMGKASLDGLNDLTNSLYAWLDLKYRMPVEINIDLYLSSQDEPSKDKKAVHIPLTVEPAPTNGQGWTTDAKDQLIPVELPEKVRDLLKEKAYAQVKITVPADKHDKIALSKEDYVKVIAWIELTININK